MSDAKIVFPLVLLMGIGAWRLNRSYESVVRKSL
jgi:hypothetical protein